MNLDGDAWYSFEGVDEAHTWALRHLQPKAALATHEWESLREYKTGDYKGINASQRDPQAFARVEPARHHDGERHAANIAAALGRQRLPANVVVYRGFNSTSIGDRILAGASSFTDQGFFSTSLSRRTAWGFADKTQPGPIHAIIRVSRLTPCLYLELSMPDHRQFSREAEILLMRGILYVVHRAVEGAEALELELEAMVL